MISLNKYFLWFFMLCLVFTLIFGVVVAVLPQAIAGFFTALPYLISMLIVLYLFLKQQKRAPSDTERKKLTLGFTFIFWIYNLLGLLAGVLLFSRNDPEVWKNFLYSLSNTQFLSISVIMWLMLAIPLYLITFWFYGPQAKRMANKMFGQP